jgi:hypothetical protein
MRELHGSAHSWTDTIAQSKQTSAERWLGFFGQGYNEFLPGANVKTQCYSQWDEDWLSPNSHQV